MIPITRVRRLIMTMVAVVAMLTAGTTTASAAQLCAVPTGVPSFRIGSHNVLRGAADFTPFAGVIGWQEVNDPADRRAMRRQLGGEYRHFIPEPGPARAIPISWRAGMFELLGGRAVKTHDGRAKVTPDRYITIARLRQKNSGRKFAVVNTHFISGAFRAGSTHTEWRLARWKEHRQKLVGVLRELRRNHPNMPIYVVGDFNHHGYLDFSSHRVHPVRASRGKPIDQIYAGRPGDGGCTTRLSRAGSDHHRWRAQVWMNTPRNNGGADVSIDAW